MAVRQAKSVDFRILGPLEVCRRGEQLDVGGAKQRAVLALLLLDANRVVSVERLIDALWGDAPPERATNAVQVYVSQLRKILEPGLSGSARMLQTRPPGYALMLGSARLDLRRFEELLAAGREAVLADELERAAERLRAALALWRGACLSELSLQGSARTATAGLEDLRLAAYEDLIAVELALGRHVALIPQLEALVSEHPYRESLRAHLMLALYRAGRQADALEAYRLARETLIDELGIEPSRELHRLEQEILRHEPVLDLVPRSGPAPSGTPLPDEPAERRTTVVVAVSDLVIEVEDGRELDPEVIDGVSGRAFDLVRGAAARHHGVVYRVAGARAIVVFGAARVHEDDALRAARASLEADAALAELSAELERVRGVRVGLRIAIEAGVAVVGRDDPGQISVSGGVVLEAERAASSSVTPGVLVGTTAQSLLAGAARLEPSTAPSARGFVRLCEVERRASASPRRHDSPLVGRADELATLRRAVARVSRERRCLLVTVLGDAGVGKSRLALELGGGAAGARLVWGACRSYGEAVTFSPLADIVAELAGGAPSEAAVAELLSGDSDARRVAGVLAGALSGGPPAMTEEVFRAARRLLEVAARERPLVVVLDDVHWAEPTFLDLVEHVAEWSREAPILLLCLARPELLEERASWGSVRANGGTVLLEPLSEAESLALIGQLDARDELAAETRRRIGSVAGGNPFFVEQLLTVAAQEPASAGALASPPSVQALLAARLDRLPHAERQALEHAAVLGGEFAVEALEALLRERPEGALRLLVRRRLLAPVDGGFAEPERYAFAHALVREAAYDALPKRRRAVLHAEHAEWLEETDSRPPAELDELVGYHLEQAYLCLQELGEPEEQLSRLGEKAAARLVSAGRRAFAISDMPKAVSLFTRAARLLEGGAPARAETLAELGESLRDAGELERAEATLDEAVAAARRSGDEAAEARALAVHWQIRLHTDHDVSFEEAANAIGATIDRLTELGHERGLARAWVSLAQIPYLRGHLAASEQALERGLAHARGAGDLRTEALAMTVLVGVAMYGPMPAPAAIGRCEQILAETSGGGRVAAAALRALAGLNAMQGRFDEAWRYLERDRAIIRDLGLRMAASSSALIAGSVGLLGGDPVRAESEVRWGYDILAEVGDRAGLASVAAMLAETLLAQGRDGEALALAAGSRDSAAPEDLEAQIGWRGPTAKALARRGELDQAERLAREAVELAAGTELLTMHGNALLDLAEVLRHAHRGPEAAAAAEAAAALFARKGNLVSLASARAASEAATVAPL